MTEIAPSSISCLPEKYQVIAERLMTKAKSIEGRLQPASPDVIVQVSVKMAKRLRKQPEFSGEEVLAAYREALEGLPAWAIEEASKMFLSGAVQNHTGQYMPTCAEFAKVVREIVRPLELEWRSIRTRVNHLKTECQEEQRRIEVEAFRNNPEARARILLLIEDATKGLPTLTGPSAQHSMTDERRRALDAYRKPEPPHKSKIGHKGKS